MTVIPPGNASYYFSHGVGPYIWMSNNTTGNAFRLVYYGVGNNTATLQFSANNLDSNTGYIGNGEIQISNSSGVLIHDIDWMGNQWIFTPTTANAAVIYYANTTSAGLGPNVAFTPSGQQTMRRRNNWRMNGSPPPVSEAVYVERTTNNESPPHGYLWVANGTGTSGTSNNLNWDSNNSNHAANNLLLYVYRCNSSFNPTYNSTGGTIGSLQPLFSFFHPHGDAGSGGGYLGPNNNSWTGIAINAISGTVSKWDRHTYDAVFNTNTSPSGWYKIDTAANTDSVFGPNPFGAAWNTSGNATVSNTAV
jgi:hypothetical protein